MIWTIGLCTNTLGLCIDHMIGSCGLHGPPSTLRSMVDHDRVLGLGTRAPAGPARMCACARPCASIRPDCAIGLCCLMSHATYFGSSFVHIFDIWTLFRLFLDSLDFIHHPGPHCGLSMDQILRHQISTISILTRYLASTYL